MPKPRYLLFRIGCIMLLALVIFCFFPSASFSASKTHIYEKIITPFFENNENQMQFHTLLAKKKKSDWKNREDLSPEEKKFLEEKYKEWKSLSPDEKKLIRKRLNKWKKMSPEERELYQRIFRQWKNLTPKERKKLQEELDRWEYLPPHEKDAIRHQFKN